MKTKEQIEDEIKRVKEMVQYKQPPANVAINAPLALIQCTLEGKIKALEWVLEL